jgi:hypothetical protein
MPIYIKYNEYEKLMFEKVKSNKFRYINQM